LKSFNSLQLSSIGDGFLNQKKMKIGTDFSGIGSPEMALKMLGIEHKQVFACEIDKYARKSHRAIYGEDYTLYEDITKRDHSEVEQLDLYVAGFPCQSFSMAGKRKGFEDTRGTLFFNVAEFIKINQPKCFILENVKGLLSHEGGKTFQTIISLLTDNGGTANGQMFIPYFEDGLGYHIYYKVLNTKHYGIPQNRERIFLVGFKEFREFRFPKPFALELRLKDMLQDNPEYKHFLSDKMVNKLKKHKNPIVGKSKNDDYSACIHAGYHKMGGRDQQYVIDDKYYLSDKNLNGLSKGQSEPQISDGNDICRCFTAGGNSGGMHSSMTLIVDDKYYLSDKMLDYFKVHNDRHEKKGTGFMWQPKEGDDVANALSANASLNATDNTIKVSSATKKGYEEAEDTACNQAVVHNIPEQVKIRKFQVDIIALQKCLKKHKKYSNKVISEKLQVKKTTVDHWFRTDKHFSIPDANIWIQLRELLEIKKDVFDESIMTFIIQDGVFEKSNRVYDELGISPTLTKASSDEKILTKDFKIRRLTPLECWRLQGYPDVAFFKAQEVNSDTQLYKQAGNSITVNVMMELFKSIFNDNNRPAKDR
jgi:DNA-cytosine methyltransferase